jgi:DNA-binding response OmpR family regulator
MKDKARRILIIDPDPLFAGKLRATLSCQGYDVEAAEGITQAVQRLRDVDFDCVIVDEDLPEMKGHDAVSVLRAIRPEAPIIMTATRNTSELESRIRRQGVFFYYVKSFDMHELQLAVGDAFRKIGKGDPTAARHRPARILIVDDDREFVEAVAKALADGPYEVSVALSKAEAIRMIESVRPDLVVLDITMDGLTDGLAICKKLKYDRELRHIPVLVVSSVTEKTGFGRPWQPSVEELAADDYLAKPVRSADLRERVGKLLG